MKPFDLSQQYRAGQKSDFNVGRKIIDIDFHFIEKIPHMLEKVNPRQMMEMVKDAGADTVMIYAKDHWGNVYHETKVAHKHEGIKIDLLGEWLEEAKKLDLKTIVFFSLMWDQYAAAKNPDWVSLNPDGSIKYWYGNWKFLSFNSPYRDYIFEHMRELVSNYQFDFIFVDPFNGRLGVNYPDYNQYDQKLYRAMYGTDIPVNLVGKDKSQYMEFRDKFFGRFLKELYSTIRSYQKNIKITHIYGGNTDFDDYLNVEGDPFGQDYYAVSMKSKVYRAYAEGRPLIMLTERFNRYWDFVPKNKEQLQWELATAFSHNISSMLVDHADITGALDPEIYHEIKHVYKSVEPILAETAKTEEVFAEIGLLYHEKDEELSLEEKPAEELPVEERYRATVYRGYLTEFVGAFKYLTESHLPFDVFVQTQITKEYLSRYKLIILPNTVHLSEEQIGAIQEYVRDGGKLVFTYRTSTKKFDTELHSKEKSLLGLVTIDIEDPYPVTFIKPLLDCGIPYIRVNKENCFVTPNTSFDTLGLVQLPATARTIDRFISHNDPPGELTNYPGVLHGKYGKGEFIYFTFKAFTELLEQDVKGYRIFIDKTIGQIFTPQISVVAPRNVEANYYSTKGGIKVFLTNVNVGRPAGRYDLVTPSPEPYSYPCNIEEAFEINGLKIITQNQIEVASTSNQVRLNVHKENGKSIIELPSLKSFMIVDLIQKQKE